jgi:hypothetical protein
MTLLMTSVCVCVCKRVFSEKMLSDSEILFWSIIAIQILLTSHSIQIRALSAASAAKVNITPVRWQHPSHVAIVPTESKGKTEGNDWNTACGNFKT